MSCKGLHCNGCGDGGGGAVVLAVVVALVLIAAIGKAIAPAVRTAGHVLEVVLEAVIIGLAVLAAAMVAAVLGWAVLRVYRWRSARRARVVQQAGTCGCIDCPPVIRAEVISPDPLSIEAPKPRLASHLVPGIHDYTEGK